MKYGTPIEAGKDAQEPPNGPINGIPNINSNAQEGSQIRRYADRCNIIGEKSSNKMSVIDPIALVQIVSKIAQKAMTDNRKGSNKGYFTKDDWVFECQMWPNLHWTENEAEQTLYALIEEDKLQEIEGPGSGKFEPTEKLSNHGGSV